MMNNLLSRNVEIYQKLTNGVTREELAERYQLSYQRIYQIGVQIRIFVQINKLKLEDVGVS